MSKRPDHDQYPASDRLKEHAEEKELGLAREFWEFLKTNKRWWLAPIIISLLLFAALVVLSSQAAVGPWIYSFF